MEHRQRLGLAIAALFEAKSIALIGASERQGPLGSIIGANLIEGRFKRRSTASILAALEDTILRLSELLYELPSVMELDINPPIVDDQECTAIDGRIVVRRMSPNAARNAHMSIHPYPGIPDAWDIDAPIRIQVRFRFDAEDGWLRNRPILTTSSNELGALGFTLHVSADGPDAYVLNLLVADGSSFLSGVDDSERDRGLFFRLRRVEPDQWIDVDLTLRLDRRHRRSGRPVDPRGAVPARFRPGAGHAGALG